MEFFLLSWIIVPKIYTSFSCTLMKFKFFKRMYSRCVEISGIFCNHLLTPSIVVSSSLNSTHNLQCLILYCIRSSWYYIWDGVSEHGKYPNTFHNIYSRIFFVLPHLFTFFFHNFKHTISSRVPKHPGIPPILLFFIKGGEKGKHHPINFAPLNLFKGKKNTETRAGVV